MDCFAALAMTKLKFMTMLQAMPMLKVMTKF